MKKQHSYYARLLFRRVYDVSTTCIKPACPFWLPVLVRVKSLPSLWLLRCYLSPLLILWKKLAPELSRSNPNEYFIRSMMTLMELWMTNASLAFILLNHPFFRTLATTKILSPVWYPFVHLSRNVAVKDINITCQPSIKLCHSFFDTPI